MLTQANIDEYWERGYWVSPKLFDDEQIARLRAAHERLWAGQHDHLVPPQYGVTAVDPASPRARQQCNAFWLNDEIRRAVTSPILGEIGAQLMGVPSVRLWHDQAIYKPGTAGQETTNAGNIGWHQDYGYWQASSSTNMCTAWVALQDTDLTNGGMRTIVGSHKWGLVEGSDGFGVKELESAAARFASLGGGQWLDEPCLLQAGQVSFHHCLTFHGSGPNLTDQPRMCVVAHMMPADTVYREGRQWHPNLVFLGPNAHDGQPFSGDYWPVLWPVA
jgi:ectoine hydroxylase-related dioxygenase (phytanoyl-CoA dioxygenase family)